LKIANLGKPIASSRVRGLAFSRDGDLWGVGGEPGAAARLFVYRTAKGGYESAGMLHVNRTPYYAWLAYEANPWSPARTDALHRRGQPDGPSLSFVSMEVKPDEGVAR